MMRIHVIQHPMADRARDGMSYTLWLTELARDGMSNLAALEPSRFLPEAGVDGADLGE